MLNGESGCYSRWQEPSRGIWTHDGVHGAFAGLRGPWQGIGGRTSESRRLGGSTGDYYGNPDPWRGLWGLGGATGGMAGNRRPDLRIKAACRGYRGLFGESGDMTGFMEPSRGYRGIFRESASIRPNPRRLAMERPRATLAVPSHQIQRSHVRTEEHLSRRVGGLAASQAGLRGAPRMGRKGPGP